MQLPKGEYCPLLKKKCIGLKCMWFTKLEGTDTNTGKPVDEYACATSWIPMLLVENSGMQRATGAAVESFRNEMVKANESSIKLLEQSSQQLKLGDK